MNDARNTKYCIAIQAALETHGHATNAQLLAILRQQFPEVSATTIHRATARLAGRGSIATAPPAPDGSMRYDTNTLPHDHFICQECDCIRDLDIAGQLAPQIERSLEGCMIDGRLTVTGICKHCNVKEEL